MFPLTCILLQPQGSLQRWNSLLFIPPWPEGSRHSKNGLVLTLTKVNQYEYSSRCISEKADMFSDKTSF